MFNYMNEALHANMHWFDLINVDVQHLSDYCKKNPDIYFECFYSTTFKIKPAVEVR